MFISIYLVACILLSLTIKTTLGLKGKNDLEAYGVVLLDSITFPKIIPSSNHHTFVLFVDKGKIGLPTTDSVRDHFLGIASGN